MSPFLHAEVVEGLDYYHIFVWADDPESSGFVPDDRLLIEVFSISKLFSNLGPGRN